MQAGASVNVQRASCRYARRRLVVRLTSPVPHARCGAAAPQPWRTMLPATHQHRPSDSPPRWRPLRLQVRSRRPRHARRRSSAFTRAPGRARDDPCSHAGGQRAAYARPGVGEGAGGVPGPSKQPPNARSVQLQTQVRPMHTHTCAADTHAARRRTCLPASSWRPSRRSSSHCCQRRPASQEESARR